MSRWKTILVNTESGVEHVSVLKPQATRGRHRVLDVCARQALRAGRRFYAVQLGGLWEVHDANAIIMPRKFKSEEAAAMYLVHMPTR